MDHLRIDPVAASLQRSGTSLPNSSERKATILRCQLVLFSAYRIDQYGDPEGFKASLGAVLEQYPDGVIRYVCDPRTGIQRKCKFPPTVSEIVEACDDRAAYLRQQERFANWGNNEPKMLEPPRENRPSYDELKAKYGENWGLKSPDEKPKGPTFKAPTLEELQHFYARNPERIVRLMGEQGE